MIRPLRPRPVLVLLLLASLSALLGAGERSRSAAFLPVHFVEDVPSSQDPLLDRGTTAAIGEESRPVLFATRPIESDVDCGEQAAPVRECEVPLPSRSPGSWVVIETRPKDTRAGRRLVTLTRYRPGSGTAMAWVHLPPGKKTVHVTARFAPEPAVLDVVTAPVQIPARSVLRFGLGVEEVAWSADFPPTEFVITAVDGETMHEVFRRVVDPAWSPTDRGWLEQQVDLAALAGKTVRFRFVTRPAGRDRSHPVVPLWADPVLIDPAARTAVPSVVLVSLDTLRAKSVGAYGSARPTTPHLDAFAAEGTLFEQAIAPYPQTLPSHMSLFTGLYPRTHGVLLDTHARLAPEHRTLPEVLRAAGYETAAFTEDGWLVGAAGFSRGFGRYVEDRTTSSLFRATGSIEKTFGGGVAWLRAHADRPFFLFLHTYQVHWPYRPPPDYLGYFADEGAMTPGEDGDDRLRYEQEVRYADDQLGRLLREIDALGLRDRTLVVVTSDHGEEFLEHGRLQHGVDLYDEVLRVPLVARLPGVVPAGRRVPTLVSLVDVSPTVFDLLGLDPLARADGMSLVPLLHPGGVSPRTAVFAEVRSLLAIRTATAKCIVNRDHASSEYECYDLVGDPAESRPLDVARDGASVGNAIAALEAVVADRGAVPTPAHPELSPETREKLRALGYVQ